MNPLLPHRIRIVAAIAHLAVCLLTSSASAEVLFAGLTLETIPGQGWKTVTRNLGDVPAEFTLTWTDPRGRTKSLSRVELQPGQSQVDFLPVEYPMPGFWRVETYGICTLPDTPLECNRWFVIPVQGITR